MPETKVIAMTIVAVLGAVVSVVSELQGAGVDLPGVVAAVAAVLGPLVGYLTANRTVSPSSRAVIAAEHSG